MSPAREKVNGITIDGRATKDIDDAIWVEEREGGYRIWVSIADAARGIPAGSDLDEYARGRLATRYHASGNDPMLPRVLGEYKLSLWPGRVKKTITIEVDLDAQLQRTAFRLYRSTLTSRAKLDYAEIPGIVQKPDHALQPMLALAKRVTDGLLAQRRAMGAMVVYDLTHGWVSVEEGHVKQLLSVDDTFGYIIIQELMILANRTVADHAGLHQVPVLYRNHKGRKEGLDRPALLAQIEEAMHTPLANLAFVQQRTFTMLEKARYGATNEGHYGLNLLGYLHFTSPIRRYADLVNHQQLRAHLKGDPLPYTQEALDALGEDITTRQLAAVTERSERAKGRAKADALRAVETGRLGRATPVEFTRALKELLRGGEAPPAGVVDEFLRRMGQVGLGEVPLLAAMLVMVQGKDGWRSLQQAILARLVASPAHAVSLLVLATDGLIWPTTRLSLGQEGPSHAPVFTAQVDLLREPPLVGPSIRATTQKAAHQRASVGLLARAIGAPDPVYPDAPPLAPPAPKAPPPPDTGHPVSLLGEWCQTRKKTAPSYTYTSEGPGHALVFTCTVKVAGIERKGTARSKGDAKSLAAAAAYGFLTRPV